MLGSGTLWFSFLFAVLGIGLRVSHMQGKYFHFFFAQGWSWAAILLSLFLV
jgi:hypothetical protein